MQDNELHLTARCALLDIEGTVADIRFVYDVMFPFIRREVESFLISQWETAATQKAIETIAQDAGSSVSTWLGDQWHSDRMGSVAQVVFEVHRLMDLDSKSTGLKMLQGLIWESGFQSGALRAELFPDVLSALQRWKEAGVRLCIYSSGSVLAQKLFFGHTTQGDLLSYFESHFDTTIGSKKETSSYSQIASICKLKPAEVVFFTDVDAELEAASAAGMQVVACVRPNNKPLNDPSKWNCVSVWDRVEIGTAR